MADAQPTSGQIENILSTARAKAEEFGATVVIAVVGRGGDLVGYLRMPGALLVSADLAIDKAWTAAGFGASTRDVGALLDKEDTVVREGLLKRPRMTIVPGGLPLFREGQCISGVGVSGGSAAQDEAIADAAARSVT
jgi:glc operon protein GlcG